MAQKGAKLPKRVHTVGDLIGDTSVLGVLDSLDVPSLTGILVIAQTKTGGYLIAGGLPATLGLARILARLYDSVLAPGGQ